MSELHIKCPEARFRPRLIDHGQNFPRTGA
jgi:hypothetical protein